LTQTFQLSIIKIRKGVYKMNDIVTLIVNNGIGVVVVAYLIYFQATTMKEMNKTLSVMTTRLEMMNQDIEEIKGKLK